jgi:hypothetical protein
MVSGNRQRAERAHKIEGPVGQAVGVYGEELYNDVAKNDRQ